MGGAGPAPTRTAQPSNHALARLLEREGRSQPPSQALGASTGAGASADVPEDVAARILALRGSGSALPPGPRADMEEALGHQFGDVRVHTGAESDRLGSRLGAQAFTVGRDVFFREGRYAPATSAGRLLLAHELAHVLQQRDAAPAAGAPTRATMPDEVSEREAHRTAGHVAEHGLPVRGPSQEPPVPRTADGAVQHAAGASGGAGLVQRTPEAEATHEALADATAPGGAATLDEHTFAGFSSWFEAAVTDADDACVQAYRVSNWLPDPYQERLRDRIDGVVDWRNWLVDNTATLEAGGSVPVLTADPHAPLAYLEHLTEALDEIRLAWQAVGKSGFFQFVALITDRLVDFAQELQEELAECRAEVEQLTEILDSSEIRQAQAQLSINLGIAVGSALIALSFANPLVGVAVAVGATAASATVDSLLGPSGPDEWTVSSAGVTMTGAAAEVQANVSPDMLPSQRAALRQASRRLGAVGTAIGTASDIAEISEAKRRYEYAARRFAEVAERIDRIAGMLERLRPLLEFPEQARQRAELLRAHADVLFEEGQLVLREGGQL